MPGIQSMTAFARREAQFPWGSLQWEIRSVNHRYLEPQFRLPESLRQLEMPCRDRTRERLGRGKVDCSLRLTLEARGASDIQVNESTLDQLSRVCRLIETRMGGLTRPNTLDILSWPGITVESAVDMEVVAQEATVLLDAGLDELVAMRGREGAKLSEMLSDRLDRIEQIVSHIKDLAPAWTLTQRQKLVDRFAELRTALDPQRLEQELVLFAQKADVAEEIDRLSAHVIETRRNLAAGGACGRRLDFLMQEFNREANTLASKSVSCEATQYAVDLKVLIEQMREQVQNIE